MLGLGDDLLQGEGGEVRRVAIVRDANNPVSEGYGPLEFASEAVHPDRTNMKRDRVIAGIILIGGSNGEDNPVDRARGHHSPGLQGGNIIRFMTKNTAQVVRLKTGVYQMPSRKKQCAHVMPLAACC